MPLELVKIRQCNHFEYGSFWQIIQMDTPSVTHHCWVNVKQWLLISSNNSSFSSSFQFPRIYYHSSSFPDLKIGNLSPSVSINHLVLEMSYGNLSGAAVNLNLDHDDNFLSWDFPLFLYSLIHCDTPTVLIFLKYHLIILLTCWNKSMSHIQLLNNRVLIYPCVFFS